MTYYLEFGHTTFIVSSLPAMLSKGTQNERVFLNTYTVIQWNNERTFYVPRRLEQGGGPTTHDSTNGRTRYGACSIPGLNDSEDTDRSLIYGIGGTVGENNRKYY